MLLTGGSHLTRGSIDMWGRYFPTLALPMVAKSNEVAIMMAR